MRTIGAYHIDSDKGTVTLNDGREVQLYGAHVWGDGPGRLFGRWDVTIAIVDGKPVECEDDEKGGVVFLE